MVSARFFPAKIQLAKRLVSNYSRRAFFFSLMFRTITQALTHDHSATTTANEKA